MGERYPPPMPRWDQGVEVSPFGPPPKEEAGKEPDSMDTEVLWPPTSPMEPEQESTAPVVGGTREVGEEAPKDDEAVGERPKEEGKPKDKIRTGHSDRKYRKSVRGQLLEYNQEGIQKADHQWVYEPQRKVEEHVRSQGWQTRESQKQDDSGWWESGHHGWEEPDQNNGWENYHSTQEQGSQHQKEGGKWVWVEEDQPEESTAKQPGEAWNSWTTGEETYTAKQSGESWNDWKTGEEVDHWGPSWEDPGKGWHGWSSSWENHTQEEDQGPNWRKGQAKESIKAIRAACSHEAAPWPETPTGWQQRTAQGWYQ